MAWYIKNPIALSPQKIKKKLHSLVRMALSPMIVSLCKGVLRRFEDLVKFGKDFARKVFLKLSLELLDLDFGKNLLSVVIIFKQGGLTGPPSPGLRAGPAEAHHSPIYIPYVPEPEYPEFMPPEDHVFPAEEQPLPAVVSPTADSRDIFPV
ncbi:hypothetical protein Tco_1282535 [Tanacetum coccineum]